MPAVMRGFQWRSCDWLVLWGACNELENGCLSPTHLMSCVQVKNGKSFKDDSVQGQKTAPKEVV